MVYEIVKKDLFTVRLDVTSAYVNKWTEQNPAAGQCLVTALAVQDEYGGDIYDCKVGRSRHFYNVVNDEIVDLTFNQFPEGSEIKDKRKNKK